MLKNISSVFVTAIIAALIAFLQTLVVPAEFCVLPETNVTDAGVLGGVLQSGRKVLQYTKFKIFT